MALTAFFVLVDVHDDEGDVISHTQNWLRGFEGHIYEATMIEVKGEGNRINLQEDDD